jgi:hypothetical protein
MTVSPLLRIPAGFLAAPMAPALVLVGSGIAFGQDAPWTTAITVAALLGYPLALLLGIPVYVLLTAKGWNGFWTYAVVGALFGAAIYLLYFPPSDYADAIGKLLERSLGIDAGSLTDVGKVSLSVMFGMIATVSFWLVTQPPRSRV